MSTTLKKKRLSIHDVAVRLGVHDSCVWRWIYHGVRGAKLPSYCIGGRRYVRVADLRAFLDRDPRERQAEPMRRVPTGKRASQVLDRAGV